MSRDEGGDDDEGMSLSPPDSGGKSVRGKDEDEERT